MRWSFRDAVRPGYPATITVELTRKEADKLMLGGAPIDVDVIGPGDLYRLTNLLEIAGTP